MDEKNGAQNFGRHLQCSFAPLYGLQSQSVATGVPIPLIVIVVVIVVVAGVVVARAVAARCHAAHGARLRGLCTGEFFALSLQHLHIPRHGQQKNAANKWQMNTQTREREKNGEKERKVFSWRSMCHTAKMCCLLHSSLHILKPSECAPFGRVFVPKLFAT